jgi:myo-inositol-1-phosphate synthase
MAPAEGRLAILMPGLGAVACTFVAGVELIKLGLGEPIGSLTQLGTISTWKADRQPHSED